MNLTIAICDDKKSAVKIIADSVETLFNRHGIQTRLITCTSVEDLVVCLEKNNCDLAFIDIEMPGTDGIEFGHLLREKGNNIDIVYVSGREDRMYDAFSIHPFGFVRKRVFSRDIAEVIAEYIKKCNSGRPEIMTIKVSGGIRAVEILNITYIKAMGKYQAIYLNSSKDVIMAHSQMDILEKNLYDKGFLRTHKGYIVNLKYVSLITTNNIVMSDGEEVPISRNKVQKARESYMEYVSKHNFF